MRTYEGMVRRLIYTTSAITITEEVMTVSCMGAGPYDITLPTAQDAAGLIFIVRCDDVAIAGIVGVASADGANMYVDGAVAAAVIDMTALDDYTILYSDGNNWYELAGEQT